MKEDFKRPEFAPKLIVYCATCHFQYVLEGTTKLDRISMENIADRHLMLNPTHTVGFGEIKLPT